MNYYILGAPIKPHNGSKAVIASLGNYNLYDIKEIQNSCENNRQEIKLFTKDGYKFYYVYNKNTLRDELQSIDFLKDIAIESIFIEIDDVKIGSEINDMLKLSGKLKLNVIALTDEQVIMLKLLR